MASESNQQFGDAPWWAVMLMASPAGLWLIKQTWPALLRWFEGRGDAQWIKVTDELRRSYLAEVQGRVRDHARQQEQIRDLEVKAGALDRECKQLRADCEKLQAECRRLTASGHDC